jgi:hypothetical protein
MTTCDPKRKTIAERKKDSIISLIFIISLTRQSSYHVDWWWNPKPGKVKIENENEDTRKWCSGSIVS